jgi:hypothetical protein
MLALCGAAGAGTIDVTSDLGAHNYAALCVLRDAITTANTGTATGGCTIAAPPPPTVPDSPDCLCTANTIVLPAGATITLTEVDDASVNTGLPSITGSLTITGNGSTVRRDPALGCNQDGINDAGEICPDLQRQPAAGPRSPHAEQRLRGLRRLPIRQGRRHFQQQLAGSAARRAWR